MQDCKSNNNMDPVVEIRESRRAMRALVRPLWIVLVGSLALAVVDWPQRLSTRVAAAPTTPKRLGKYGGIEIGSTGVKSLAVEFLEDEAGGIDIKDPIIDTKNTNLGDVIKDPLGFDPKKLEATKNAVKGFFETMRDKHGVAPERIHVAASSGLFARFGSNGAAIEKARGELSKAIKEATGIKPIFIDSEQEGTLGAQAIIPPKERTNAVIFDIGGGNTNGGYFDGKKAFHSLGVKYGTRSFHALVKQEAKDGASFAETANRLRDSVLKREVHAMARHEPDASKRSRVYMIGGIVWAMTTVLHPQEQVTAKTSRIRLAPEDFDRFAEFVGSHGAEALRDKIATGTDRDAIRKELQAVQAVFNPEQLLAGAQILKALASEYELRDREKKVYFYRSGQVSWLMGYLQNQAELAKEKRASGEGDRK